MRFVFLVSFYSNCLGHESGFMLPVYRVGSSPREVLDAEWSALGKPGYHAELVVHDEGVRELFPADVPDLLPAGHLVGRVRRIEVRTVGRIAEDAASAERGGPEGAP